MMTISFILWAMGTFNGMTFGICGKTVQSAERNIIAPLLSVKSMTDHYVMAYTRSTHLLAVRKGAIENHFFIFGGKDESSYMLIQGVTLAGVLLDEVALMPRSFVEQAITRTLSVDSAKLWFNCNPEGPSHWFYSEWIQKPEEKKAKLLHFLLEDNPSLTAKALERAKAQFSGVFYDRYILGKWVRAEGVIYPMFSEERHAVDTSGMSFSRWYISVDYGTLNPFSAGLWGQRGGVWYRVREYYHDGRAQRRQLTDEEYYAELVTLAGDTRIESVVIDPSAASFIACIRKHGKFIVRQADNSVLDGIRNTAVALSQGKIRIDKSCKAAIKEFYSYVWDEKATEDKPIKDNDHAMDDTRYFVQTILSKPSGAITIRGI